MNPYLELHHDGNYWTLKISFNSGEQVEVSVSHEEKEILENNGVEIFIAE